METELLTEQAARIRLVAQHRNARQPIRELSESITVLGSGDGCDLILASSKVDAAHAAIVRLNGTAYLCDLGAPGGTVLNGRRVRWVRLSDGDIPAVGPFSFRVELQEEGLGGTADLPSFSLRNDRAIGTVKSVDPVIVVGSDPACDVVLGDASVAPRHAMIVWTQQGPIVRDLLRRNGVRRNGEKVNAAVLANGDCIGVGRFELIFETLWSPTERPVQRAVQSGTSQTARRPITEDEAVAILTNLPGMSEATPMPKSLADSLAIPLTPADRVGATHVDAQRGQADAEPVWTPQATANADTTITSGANDADGVWKARVAAAQNALDERARKMWEGIQVERERLRAYQEELQTKSQELLDAAKKKHNELLTREQELERAATEPREAEVLTQALPTPAILAATTTTAADRPRPVAATPTSEVRSEPAYNPQESPTLERLFSGLFEPEAATLRNAEETARLAAMLVNEGIKTPELDTNLARRAAELAELVRFEREEMENSEGRLETLRFEIERLQAAVSRNQERQKLQESQLEARLQTIRATQGALRQEREDLAARIRQLDAKDSALKARMEEADRVRRELEREARQLARTQEEHEERRRELRLNIESERHRLRVRQAELQKKAAELVKAAKEKRRLIESEVAVKQAEIAEREIELKSRRSALEDAGRAQMEKTSAELEQVLTVRLNDIESEVTRRQSELDERMQELLAVGGNSGEANEATSLEMSLDEIAALARLEEISQNDDGRLESLRLEVEALRQAVGNAGKDEAALRNPVRDSQLAALTSRRNQLQREQRWASILRAKLNDKISTLRGAEAAGRRNDDPQELETEQPATQPSAGAGTAP